MPNSALFVLVSLFALPTALTLPSAFAEEETGIVKMLAVSPSTTFDGRKILENAVIGTLGTIKTGTDGGAKVKILKNGITLDIAYGSELKIIRPAKGEPHETLELVDGAVRVRVPELKSSGTKTPFTLRTKTVSMGVRGTDFLGIVNPMLDESEIVVFKGKVEFISAASAKDFRVVTPGYWGGIGGRFGKKTRELIKLPPTALAHYEKIGLDTPSFSVEKAGGASQSSESSK